MMVMIMLLLMARSNTLASSGSWLPRREMSALHHFHDGTGGDTWTWRENEIVSGSRWNFTLNATSGEYLHNPCSDENARVWQGITCSNSSDICASQVCHVISLDLSRYNLQGTLSSSLSDLSHLEYIGFYDNAIYGSIPDLHLHNLEFLDLYSNQLSAEIPISLCQLTALQYLYLGVNNLDGSLLSELGQLVGLKYLSLQNNLFSGTMLPELGLLVQLKYLYLNGNFLEGPLPAGFGRCVNMEYLSLYDNFLNGPLFPEIGHMVKLNTLYVSHNLLTGPLAPALGELVLLRYILIYDNMFSGPLPPDIGQLAQLQYLSLYDNLFTGPMLPELGKLLQLEYISFYNNMFTGQLLPELSLLVKLEYISLTKNFLTGPLLPGIGELVKVELLTLAENFFTGSVVSELGQLTLLDELRLSSNHFEHSLPAEFLSQCQKLRVFLVHANLLTGSLEGVFAASGGGAQTHNMETQSYTGSMASLENLDLSDNRLSGAIPQDIFELPRISAIALSLNCFEGTLPEGMCVARNVSVLSMDGLGAAEGCKHAVTVPLSGVRLFGTLDGSLPPCVWSLPRLTVLHFTGNGLSGEISDVTDISSSLRNISLAHNKIRGTLPDSIQEKAFEYLDLSYNKLTGTYDGYSESAASNSSRLFLEVNRLSGHFPSRFGFGWGGGGGVVIAELSALRGNLFGCGSIPDEDAYSDEYTCGSEELDVTLYLVASILVLLGMVAMCAFHEAVRRHLVRHARAGGLYRLLKDHNKYFTYLQDDEIMRKSSSPPTISIARIRTFGQQLGMSIRLFGAVLGVHLVTCVPLYGLKIAEYGVTHASSYMTHSYQYRWLFSLTYLRGWAPLALLLFMWSTCICALRLLTAREGPLQRWFPWIIPDRSKNTAGRDLSVDIIETEDNVVEREREEREEKEDREEEEENEEEEEVEEVHSSKFSYVMYILIMLLNVSVVGCVNGFYIHFSSRTLPPPVLVGMQTGLALFKVAWNMLVVPLLSRPLRGVEKIVRVELFLRIVNDILLPCIVTALTSPACFQGFLVDPEEVTSSYAYTYCSRRIVESNTCLVYATTEIEVAPLVPPFSYNNLCSSVVLTSYIPVFLFVYSFQILVPIVYICLFTTTPYSSVPKVFQKVIQGVFWPAHWRRKDVETGTSEGNDRCAEPVKLLKPERIISSDVLNHLLVFFTFGICSPFLSLAVVLAASLKQYMWAMLLGRFLDLRADSTSTSVSASTSDSVVAVTAPAPAPAVTGEHAREEGSVASLGGGGGDDDATAALGVACVPILTTVVTHCVWPIVWTSSLFFSFLCWDILGDAVSWRRSLWAPVLVWSVPLCLLLSSRASLLLCPTGGSSGSSRGGRSASEANMISMRRLRRHKATSSIFDKNNKNNHKSMEENSNPLHSEASDRNS